MSDSQVASIMLGIARKCRTENIMLWVWNTREALSVSIPPAEIDITKIILEILRLKLLVFSQNNEQRIK